MKIDRDKHVSRLGIFVYFNREDKVPQYVISLLDEMRTVLDELIVVSNSEISDGERETLTRYSHEIKVRENYGLDAAAYKEGILYFAGIDKLRNYDEIVLFNDTFYGPIYSASEIFESMSERDVDLWGLGAMYRASDGWNSFGKSGYQPAHIQSYFLVFRKSLVQSSTFEEYWENYDDSLNDFVGVVVNNEMKLTEYFQARGFKWDVYTDYTNYKSDVKEENFNYYAFIPDQMIEHMGYPILKRKNFATPQCEMLWMGGGEEMPNAMHYIDTDTNYSTGQIWDNLLDMYNIYDIYVNQHLNRIIADNAAADHVPHDNAAVIISCEYADSWFYIRKYIEKIPSDIHVYLISGDIELQRIFTEDSLVKDRCEILNIVGRSTSMGELILHTRHIFEQYLYVCFVHDTQRTGRKMPPTIAESVMYNHFENLLHSEGHIDEILRCFESNKHLGLLMAPKPVHNMYFKNLGEGWDGTFETVKELASELNLKCVLDDRKPPISYGGSFWCKTDAIMPVFEHKYRYQDFLIDPRTERSMRSEAFERLLPYVAQSRKYYTEVVRTSDYASLEISNIHYYLTEMIKSMQNQGCRDSMFYGFRDHLKYISW